MIPLEGNLGALKLTTSSYWRPSGRNINRGHHGPNGDDATKEAEESDWGVSPDKGYEVPLDDKQRIRLLRWRNRRDAKQKLEPGSADEELDPTDLTADPQLAKALEYVEKAAGSAQSAAGDKKGSSGISGKSGSDL